MLAGDVNLSKGPDDEFECIIEGVKPGSWTVTRINISDSDGGDDDEGDEGDDEPDEEGRIVKVVMQHSDVDSEALGDAAWEEAGSFSVDSGVWCLISDEELEKAAEESGDREATLECLADWGTDEGPKMPGGVVGKFFISLACSVL